MRHVTSFRGDPVSMAERCIRAAHNRDGLPEIAVGLIFLVVATLSYAQAVLPRESIGFKAAVLVLALIIPAFGFGAPWLVKWIRRRYLIERVGYVESKPAGRKQIGIGIAVAIVVAVALGVCAARVPYPHRWVDGWVLAGTGLSGGALAVMAGRSPRFMIAGVLMAATGIFVAVSGFPVETGFAALFGLPGLLILVSGVTRLLRMLRQPVEPGE